MDGVLKHVSDENRLMTENQAIVYLGLQGRPKPEGALRWLMRTRKLAFVRLAKGIYGFRQSDLDALIAASHVPAQVQRP